MEGSVFGGTGAGCCCKAVALPKLKAGLGGPEDTETGVEVVG